MQSFRFLDDIVTADAAFEASGDSPDELFAAAVDATMNVMVESLDSIEASRRIKTCLKKGSLEMLLFCLLEEVIFYKDAESLLLRVSDISIKRVKDCFSLRAELAGEPIDKKKHSMVVDVKAVTLYRYSLKETKDGWKATIVLDV